MGVDQQKTSSEDIDHDETSNRNHSQDYLSPNQVSTDNLNTADLAGASDGTVPVSQGDGTLTMESQSGGGANKTTAYYHGGLG